MSIDTKYINRISSKYNKDKKALFTHPNANHHFLCSIGIVVSNITEYELKLFGKDQSLLSENEEKQLFKALHFVKYKMCHVSTRTKRRYVKLYIAIRNRIISANIKLVYHALSHKLKKGHYIPNEDKCVEQGFFYMIRCVDNFDPWKGFCFSTYASSSLSHCFSFRPRRLQLEFVENLPNAAIPEQSDSDSLWQERLMIIKNSGILNDREELIINNRFGFEAELILKDVGKLMGITAERVRQIQEIALQNLRNAMQEESILQI